MKRLLILFTSIFISGCGTFYSIENEIEKDFVPLSLSFFDPSGAYAWRMFTEDGKEISPNNNKYDGIAKIIKIKILSIDEKPINKYFYIWYGSIDPDHTSPNTFTSATPTDFVYFINLAEKNKKYILTPPEKGIHMSWVITEQPIRNKDYNKNDISVKEGSKVTFIRDESFIIDQKESFIYRKYVTTYGLYIGGYYGTPHLSAKETYQRITLKTRSEKNNSELNFDSDYMKEFNGYGR